MGEILIITQGDINMKNLIDDLLRSQENCPICKQKCHATLYYDENDKPKELNYCGHEYCLRRLMLKILENELKEDHKHAEKNQKT